MALVKTQTGVTCPYSTSDSQFESARNGGAGYLITNGNTLERHRYLGLIPSSLGYSGASLIRNIRVTFQGRATINKTDGTPIGSSDTISCRIMLGDKSTSNTLFSFSGYNISLTSATETGSYVGVTGKNYSTEWINPSSAATITQTSDLLVSNAVLGVDVCARSTYKLAHKTYDWVNAVKFAYDLYVRNYVTFQGSGVVTRTTIHDHGTVPSAPTVQAATGKKFSGWRSSLDNKLYQTPPACTGLDVTYTAEYQDIDYHVGLLAVNTDNTALDVGNKLTGGGTYQIDDTFAIAADAGDTTVSGNTFLFADWTFQDANGNDMFLDESGHATHFKNEALASLTVSADTISAWWPAPAASGEHQGEYWIYGIAHYYQVYDISLNIGDPQYDDPAGVGKNGIVSISVVSDGKTQTYTKDQVLTGGIVARVANPAVQIHTTFEAENEYFIFSTAFYGVNPYVESEYTEAWQGAAFVVSGTITTSNWYFRIRAWKQYFDLDMSSDTDGVLKVYSVSSNGTRSLISPTHIPRTTKVEIEADGALMLQKTHDTAITSITPNTNTSVANGKGVITSLLQNHTITVTRTQVNCTMSKIVNSGEPTDETVVRSNSYRYLVAEESGWTISSATLTMRGTQIRSWKNVTSIDYTIQSVTGNCVLTVYRTQNPQEYITMKIPTSSYGSVNVIGDTSVLKTDFTSFVVGSITTRSTYDIEYATYEWIEGSETVGTGTINPSVQTMLRYPKSTIPADKDVYVEITVQYRKNALYHSHKQNGETISRQPRSLWYTPVGQAPKQILAVYAQTATHPEPMLLFGPAPEEVEPEPPVERTKYKVLSLESKDIFNGDTTTVHAVWTEDAGVCTPVSFSTDFDTGLYDVSWDSITASMNTDNQLVYTITIYDKNMGSDSYSFVCHQDSDGEWVYNNQRYNCDGNLLWGSGPATITTVYDDPT